MAGTEIAYVCGANYWRYLFMSLRTLLASGTSFDRVVVYVVGDSEPGWKFGDPRIEVRVVPDIGDGYWYLNKTHICKSDAERLIFLDTDTMVLSPIDEVYDNIEADVISRLAPDVYLSNYKPEKWQQFLKKASAADYPYLTCGFMVFQNQSHRLIESSWLKITKNILRGDLGKRTRFAEQQAMSIAGSLEGLRYHLMTQRQHSYAMIGETHRDAVVYHLGTPNFYHYYLPVEREMGLHSQKMAVPRPLFPKAHKIITRVRHRISQFRYGHRGLSVEHTY